MIVLKSRLSEACIRHDSNSYPESSGFLIRDGHRERPWGNGIVTAGILRLTVLSFVTVNS